MLNSIKNIFQGIFYEKDDKRELKFSLGRVLLITLFITALVTWVGGADIPGTMLTVLLTFIGYNFGTKAVTAIKEIVNHK